MWQCPKCKREFQKKKQSHSCTCYPLENHFEGKERGKELFIDLKIKIVKNIGPVKIESLPCCIHFVSSYTFAACWATKIGINIDFSSEKEIQIKRKHKVNRLSANRYVYYMDISSENEIDSELIGWLKDSYHLKNIENKEQLLA